MLAVAQCAPAHFTRDGPENAIPRKPKNSSGAEESQAEADQTSSDLDQTSSDADQTASDIDQAQSDSDQSSSDRDQAIADQELGEHPPGKQLREHKVSRAARAQSSEERGDASVLRSGASLERDKQAGYRDETAKQRDQAADERDRLADAADWEAERSARTLGPLGFRSQKALTDAARERARAADDRARAAGDRERAAADRQRAARDRKQAGVESEGEPLDELTGAFRRGIGEVVLQHEIERAQDAGGRLVLAFVGVDVGDLKASSDRDGHPAGDDVLRGVVAAIRAKLHPYDPLVRVGEDEFLCTLWDTDLDGARLRFEEIQDAVERGTITVGLSEMRPGETVAELTKRSDAEMRKERQAAR